MANIKNVADEAGVSISTVSFVLNNKSVVKEETASRVLEAARRLNYIPNHTARALRLGRQAQTMNCTGVLMPPFHPEYNTWAYQILCGIESSFHGSDEHIVMGIVHEKDGGYSFPGMLDGGHVNRLIFLPSAAFHSPGELIKQVRDFKIPMLLIDYPGQEFGLPSVVFEGRQSSYQACMHLIEQGYKTIATITGPLDYSSAIDRFNGYKLALFESNIPLREEFIFEGDFHGLSGYEGMKKILDDAELPLGVFVANDYMAKGAVRYLSERGLKIPGEVGIVGFDDAPEAILSTQPGLSSVRVHWDRIGQEAANQSKLLREGISIEKNVVIPCELVIRESSALGAEEGFVLETDCS